MTSRNRPDELEKQHTQEAIRQRIDSATSHSHVGDFVLGAVDGTITTFAIVAGAAGAGLSSGVAFTLGMANVLADGLSMAAGNYLKSRADRQVVERFRQIESMHVDQIPDGEREEIRQIFARKGFQGEILEEVVRVITSDRRRWIDTMLTEEWGLQLEPPGAFRSAWTTFVAFVLAGLVPLIPLMMMLKATAAQAFVISALLTGITFFGIGYVRGKVSSEKSPLITGLETLIIGGAAASIAYGVGAWLEQLIR